MSPIASRSDASVNSSWRRHDNSARSLSDLGDYYDAEKYPRKWHGTEAPLIIQEDNARVHWAKDFAERKKAALTTLFDKFGIM